MDDFSGLKILMVDDTPANIDVLRRILSDEGFDISVTRRGEAALTWVKKPAWLDFTGCDGAGNWRILKL